MIEPTDRDPKMLPWIDGFHAGVSRTLRAMSSQPVASGDPGLDISTVKFLRSAIQDLPMSLPVLDPYGLPLRGEISFTYDNSKGLFVYGRRYRPTTLGEPF